MTTSVRIVMPHQLRTLARVRNEVVVEVAHPVTVGAALDALELTYPALLGTLRDRETGRRRPMVRIYAGGVDLSDAPPDTRLPPPVCDGREPLRFIGAIAGG
jgi:sulfur-carrier protein